MEQLGPFHVFFTMSCAEARWACVLVEVLKVTLKRRLKIMYFDNYVSIKNQKTKSRNSEIPPKKKEHIFSQMESQLRKDKTKRKKKVKKKGRTRLPIKKKRWWKIVLVRLARLNRQS